MFQRAVLALCKAGRQDIDSIGQRLAIHTDLAAFILVELAGFGYVDQDGLATEQGLCALDEDTLDVHDMLAGYVFQDPWTGDLWPRFVEQLDYCDLEYDESGFPKLLLGTKGKPRRQGAFMVLPTDPPSPAQPSPAKVVAAVAGHRKGMRYAGNLSEWEKDLEQPGLAPSTVHIDRVSFIEEKPTPVYLMTYLYLTDSTSDAGDWYACDPFGLGVSVRLRRRVEQIMRDIPYLYQMVNRLVGRGIHDGIEEQRRWMDQLRTSAKLEVEKRLTVNVRTHAAFNQIVDMECACQEASLLEKDCPESKVHSALRACLKCLEAVFGDMSKKHPLGDVWKRVYVSRPRAGKLVPQQDRKWLEATYRAAATSVGFANSIPEALINIRPGHIRSVAEFGEQWRLRPLVMACILSAQAMPEHPLHAAARRHPRLLNDIDEVASQGGKAGHADGGKSPLSDMITTAKLTYKIISTLLGLGHSSEAVPIEENGVANG